MAIKKKKIKKNISHGNAYIYAGMNNTIVTVTDKAGQVIARASSGASGFKGTKKSTPYAAQVAAQNVIEKCKVVNLEEVSVYVKGIGPGREQAIRGLIAGGINIDLVVDRTPVPHNGCRKARARRV